MNGSSVNKANIQLDTTVGSLYDKYGAGPFGKSELPLKVGCQLCVLYITRMIKEGNLYGAEVWESKLDGFGERQIVDGNNLRPYGTTLEEILGDFCKCPPINAEWKK